jgi:predicted dehydrogenase
MHKVRLGLIGYGNMGAGHAAQVAGGKIPRLTLTAVAESNPARHPHLSGVKVFTEPAALLKSGLVDAVLIATPHPLHAPLALAALKAGCHVLLEKPFAVHKAEALPVIAAAKRRPAQVFAAVFNQRTDPYFRKIRDLIRGGTFGAVRRINWTITNWFRPEAYYKSSSWRATWAGEGGGVLLNQCPHNLDLLQWMTGMPVRVRAHCHFGRYHDIEVEDDVSAYLEYADGAHATFIASTGEAPGTNRPSPLGSWLWRWASVRSSRGRAASPSTPSGWSSPRSACLRSATVFTRPGSWPRSSRSTNSAPRPPRSTPTAATS